MILQELHHLYKRLAQNPEIDIAEPGFSKENISFSITITEDGELFDPENPISDLRDEELRPQKITVPKFEGKRTSGIKAYFLWDKTDYVLGLKKDPSVKNSVVEKETPEHHKAFLSLIDDVVHITGLDHPAVKAVQSFCKSEARIQQLRKSPYWADFLNSFIVFKFVGEAGKNIYEIEKVKKAWKEYLKKASISDNMEEGICLVSGDQDFIAHIHPTIKKGVGGKNDIPLISCNFDAGESYGRKKNANAPVSTSSASAIAGALNYLIDTPDHNIKIADTKTLFWAETNDRFADFFGKALASRDDEILSEDVAAFLKSIRSGRMPEEIKDSSRFFVLGLAPNAARVSVRFWYVDSIENIAKKIGLHFTQLQIVKQRDENQEFPSLWRLIRETATQHKTENIPPNIIGPLMRGILSGSSYPNNILSILLSRMRVDQDYNQLNYYRASFIKSILNRNYHKELTMSLDHNRIAVPYLLGRLFATLEKVQEEASGGNLNTTIKDRYFASVSTSPRAVFPRLLTLHQNHLKKLKTEKHGLAVTREKLMGEIISHLPPDLPGSIRLEDQGEFAIGYYHQRQDFFTKKEEVVSE
ncbi:MAG: type I-C CRISPR-associated protein Cas8c/Csd1 [Calditrichia bacterium]